MSYASICIAVYWVTWHHTSTPKLLNNPGNNSNITNAALHLVACGKENLCDAAHQSRARRPRWG